MNVTVNTKISYQELYDFLLYHTYSKASGLFVNVMGLAIIFTSSIMLISQKISLVSFCMYTGVAIIFLGFTPLNLKRHAKKETKSNTLYSNDWTYSFNDEKGIYVANGKETKTYGWNQIEKVVTTPKTIGFYYGTNEAFIVPKKDFGDNFFSVMSMSVDHLGLQKVRFR